MMSIVEQDTARYYAEQDKLDKAALFKDYLYEQFDKMITSTTDADYSMAGIDELRGKINTIYLDVIQTLLNEEA